MRGMSPAAVYGCEPNWYAYACRSPRAPSCTSSPVRPSIISPAMYPPTAQIKRGGSPAMVGTVSAGLIAARDLDHAPNRNAAAPPVATRCIFPALSSTLPRIPASLDLSLEISASLFWIPVSAMVPVESLHGLYTVKPYHGEIVPAPLY